MRALDLPAGGVEALEKQLHAYADANDLRMLEIRKDRYRLLRLGKLAAWLIESDVQHLIIPSMEHITNHPIARMIFCEAVCLDARAELHEACPEL
ncbi:hypothetical protein [Streptomyces sp. NPDC058479]|uniref:hypothetical protein n=1 Tax=unclassified Streptomyces TaxID=2593676 RepID=UPI003656E2DD